MLSEIIYYNNILALLPYIASFFCLLPIIIGFYNKKIIVNELIIILKYLKFSLLIMFVLIIYNYVTANYFIDCEPTLSWLKVTSSNFFSIFSFFTTFYFFSQFFSQLIPNSKLKKLILYGSWILFLITFIDYFWFTGYDNYSSVSQCIMAFYGLILPATHLWYIYREDSKVPLNRNPYFWIALGLMLPNTMTIWLELYGTRLYEADFALFCQVNIGNIVFYCIGMLLIARGFYFARYAQYLQHQP